METERARFAEFRAMMATFVKKWSVEIMYLLYKNESMRFSELSRELGGPSSRILSDRLKELEVTGLVNRRVLPEKPVRVDYMLTDAGRKVGEQAYESLSTLLEVWERSTGEEE